MTAIKDIERLILNCINRRNALLDRADTAAKKRRYMTFAGGVISIFAAVTYASITAKLIPGIIVEIFAISFALCGGVLALFASLQFNESEIMHLYIGASKYLRIIEDANIIKNNHGNQSDKEILLRLSELQNNYNSMAIDYDRYMANILPCRKEHTGSKAIPIIDRKNNSMQASLDSIVYNPYAIVKDPRYIDKTHEIVLLRRNDYLYQNSEDYYSIREIEGRNYSSTDSLFIQHVESTKVPLKFFDFVVSAYDSETKEELAVEHEGNPSSESFIHAFKIYFSKPVKPNEQFRIAYEIKIPGENRIENYKNIQSVSLARYERLRQIIFNVNVGLKPKHYNFKIINEDGQEYRYRDSECYLVKKDSISDVEKIFNLKETDDLYTLGCSLSFKPLFAKIDYMI